MTGRMGRALNVFVVVPALLFFFAPSPAHAAACVRAYESAADDYWRIVSDMTRFRIMFDNYDELCRKHYPQDMEKLQPAADLLRYQVAQDMMDIAPVMTAIFHDTLPEAVPESCVKDVRSRDRVRRNFLNTLKVRDKTMTRRMEKSGDTVTDPASLKLCRDLRALKPAIEKKLGPGLNAPLLTMTELNSEFMTKDSEQMKKAFANYRGALEFIKAKDKKTTNEHE